MLCSDWWEPFFSPPSHWLEAGVLCSDWCESCFPALPLPRDWWEVSVHCSYWWESFPSLSPCPLIGGRQACSAVIGRGCGWWAGGSAAGRTPMGTLLRERSMDAN